MTDNIDPSETHEEGTRFFTVPSGEKVVIDSNNRIETQIVIGLEDAVDRDLEQFLDFIAEAAVDNLLLMDFTYNVTGITREGALILTVNGDVSEVLNDIAEEEAYQKEKSDGDS